MRPNLSWTFDPLAIFAAAVLAAAYVRRFVQVRRAAKERAASDAPAWRLACFLGALALGVGAVVSPLDSLADQLFCMHMAQHMLLLDVAPILAILGLTKVLLRPVTRAVRELERRSGALAHPAFAVLAYVLVIWCWHIPAAYDEALRHPAVHACEHASFLLAGSLYWWHLLAPIRSRLRLGGMGPVFYMASTKVIVGALGMGLAFAPSALYPYYEHQGGIWGLSALSDQSLAGILMAVEQSIVMGIALAALFISALSQSEREQRRRERYEAA